MPLVAIDVLEGRSPEEIDGICESVQEAIVQILGAPEHDRFQVVTEHTLQTLRFDRQYLRGDRSDAFILVRVTLASGRTTEVKQSFYRRVTELLGERVGARSEDVMIVLVENSREDWSFGRGEASYVEIPKEDWR